VRTSGSRFNECSMHQINSPETQGLKEYMAGCFDKYGEEHCNNYENDRIIMNLEQPQSMVNYTSTGFKKIKAPAELFNTLKNLFDRNQDKMKEGEHYQKFQICYIGKTTSYIMTEEHFCFSRKMA
jgi:hypothetical protein